MRAILTGIGAFAIGYLLPGTLQLPVLIYDPVARTAHFGRIENAVQMRYYGDLIVACVAGVAAAAIASRLPERRTPLHLATVTALSLVALDLLFYLSRLLATM